jgi:hypothetical protein
MIAVGVSGVSTREERAILHRKPIRGRRSYDVLESLVYLVLLEQPRSTLGEIMEVLCRDVRELGVGPIRTGNVSRAVQMMMAARVLVASVDHTGVRYRLRNKR